MRWLDSAGSGAVHISYGHGSDLPLIYKTFQRWMRYEKLMLSVVLLVPSHGPSTTGLMCIFCAMTQTWWPNTWGHPHNLSCSKGSTWRREGKGEEGNLKEMAVTSSLLDRLQRIVGTCKRLCFLSRNIPDTPLQLTVASYGVLMWRLGT